MRHLAAVTARAVAAVIVLTLAWSAVFHQAGFLYGIGVRPTPQGTSPFYQLLSGFIPALTVVSLATLIGGLWHHVNCHQDGCWRVGRHHLNGQVWCNQHQKQARPLQTAEELLSQILTQLQLIQAKL